MIIDVYDVVQIIGIALSVVGFWFLFPKCGIGRWWACVPFFRDYKLAQCADMEEDGKTWVIVRLLYWLTLFGISLMELMGHASFSTYYMVVLLMIFFYILCVVYNIKIYIGLCTMFGKKHKVLWVFFMVLAEGIVSLIWGISKSTKPLYKYGENEISQVPSGTAAGLSGIQAEELDEGLTINIKERTAGPVYRRKVLLKDIHFNIRPGRMVLLLGGSGAGKTTFVNAVTGYEQADAEILLNGMDVYKRFDKMKYEIGFVPQQDLMRYNDSVYRTLSDAATLRLPVSVKRKEIKERVNDVLEIFGLTSVQKNIVGKQSGGQKKRISISSEFLSDPSLFILDEPDSGLDGILARDLMTRLHKISRQGKIVIVITHTPDRVLDLFDDVIVLAKDANRTGRLVYYGPIDEAKIFFERDTMEDVVKSINREDEGGEGRADELIEKYAEVYNGAV